MLMSVAFTDLHPTSHLDPVYRTGALTYFMTSSFTIL